MPRAAVTSGPRRARSRPSGPRSRAAAALALALALPTAARAGEGRAGVGSAFAWSGGVLSMVEETGPAGQIDGVDEAAELAATAERSMAAGATDEALTLWRRAYALLPRSIGYAQRRAGVALAIAAAEEAAFRASGEPMRLRAGIAAIDTYLAGLEPTDDENRAGAEARRAVLSDLLEGASAPSGARSPPPRATEPRRRGLDRRAALAAAGLGGAALVAGAVAALGATAGGAADRRLADATARPCDGADVADPCGSDATREALRSDALADGLRANRTAVVGAAVAGTLLAAGLAALIAAGIRGRAPARVGSRGAVLVVRF